MSDTPDILAEICRNYYLIEQCPVIQWWFADLVMSEREATADLKEATESAKLCNWDHYLSTKGWIY